MNNGRIEQVGTPDRRLPRAPPRVRGRLHRQDQPARVPRGDGQVEAGGAPLILAGAPPADRFTVSLRPEDVKIGPDCAALPNQASAQVRETLFLGHEQEVLVQAGEQELTVRAPGKDPFLPGQDGADRLGAGCRGDRRGDRAAQGVEADAL